MTTAVLTGALQSVGQWKTGLSENFQLDIRYLVDIM